MTRVQIPLLARDAVGRAAHSRREVPSAGAGYSGRASRGRRADGGDGDVGVQVEASSDAFGLRGIVVHGAPLEGRDAPVTSPARSPAAKALATCTQPTACRFRSRPS